MMLRGAASVHAAAKRFDRSHWDKTDKGTQTIGLMKKCVATSFLFNSSDSLIRIGRRSLIIFTAD